MKKSLALTLIVLALFIVLGAMRGAWADEPVHLGPLRSAGAGESGQSIALSNARADEPGRTVLLSTSGESMASAPTTGLASPVRLFLDDGLVDDQVGLTDGGEFVWLNRFTPSPALFPFTLQQVQVAFFADSNCTIGNAIDIYVYSDADGNPANGATPVGSITGQTIQRFGWSTYSTNISLSGPGDVLIGVVNRGCSSPGQFPAAIDQSGSQGRSWVGFNAGPPGNPPTLPTTTFGTIDSFGFAGNWMIRGLGESNCTVGCPTPIPWPTPPPTATVAPFPAVSLVLDDGIDDVSLGLSHGGEFLWLNRFTPPAASFPFALREVHIFFALSTFCEAGETIDIYIYQDADGNPANGATHVGSILGRTIQVIGGWSSYPTNIPLNGPGDVLIGVVSRECLYIGQSPATLDQSGSQGRSWIGSNLGPVGNPPVIPLFVFDTIDDTGFPCLDFPRNPLHTSISVLYIAPRHCLAQAPTTGDSGNGHHRHGVEYQLPSLAHANNVIVVTLD